MLRTSRIAHELSQASLATEAGVSLSTVRRAEDSQPVSFTACERICEALGLLWIAVVIGESNHPCFQEPA